jgi:hypothetical protein
MRMVRGKDGWIVRTFPLVGWKGREGKGWELFSFPLGPPLCFLPILEEVEGRAEKECFLNV